MGNWHGGGRGWRGARWLFGVVFAGSLLCVEPANAQPQVSDQFKRVARELAKRFVQAELASICHEDKDGKDRSEDRICTTVVESLTDIFALAIDRKLDPAQLEQVLRHEFSELAQAGAIELVRAKIEGLLMPVARRAAPAAGSPPPHALVPTFRGGDGTSGAWASAAVVTAALVAPVAAAEPQGPACSPAGLAQPVAECLTARVFKGGDRGATQCRAGRAALAKFLKSCGAPADLDDTGDFSVQLARARGVVEKMSGPYQVVLLLTELEQLTAHRYASFYAFMQMVATEHDKLMRDFSMPARMTVLADDLVDPVAAGSDHCSNAANVAARATRWKGERLATFGKVSRAIARRESPLPYLDALPDDLPDPGCPASDPFAKASAELRTAGTTFRVDATVAGAIQGALLPAMLVASLVDYVSTRDEALLSVSLQDFALQVLARVIAADEKENQDLTCNCKGDPGCSLDNGLSCASAGGATFAVPHQKELADDDLGVLIASRHTAVSARQSCVYQAVSALLTGSFPTRKAFLGFCTGTNSVLKNTIFERYLRQVPDAKGKPVPGLWRWADDELVPSASGAAASLRFASQFKTEAGFGLLGATLGKLGAKLGWREVDAVDDTLSSLSLGGGPVRQRQLLYYAAETLRPVLSDLLDAHFERLETCKSAKHANTLRCGMRVLTDAAYEPIVTAVSAPAAPTDTRDVMRKLYAELETLDPLNTTPVLFNVGPGATVLTRFGSDKPTAHFTLLDKLGLAARFGQRHQWEAGVFAGGFIDALIRTATDGGEDAYWLFGGTAGLRQFSRTWPFGVEVHLASALPFSTAQFSDKVAFAAGLNLIVPADIAFGSDP